MKHKLLILSAVILIITAISVFAQEPASAPANYETAWHPSSLVMSIVSTLIFSFIGIIMAIVGFKLFDLVIPFNLEREVCEKQNMAVAVLCGLMVLGICIIVSMVIR